MSMLQHVLDRLGARFADDAFDIVFTSGMLICIHPSQLAKILTELRRVARRSVIFLEYAWEHMDTPERQAIMRNAPWYGHAYGAELERARLKLISSYVFPSFHSDPARMPLSFFHAVKESR